jgi:hypothetical protein
MIGTIIGLVLLMALLGVMFYCAPMLLPLIPHRYDYKILKTPRVGFLVGMPPPKNIMVIACRTEELGTEA